MATGSYRIEVTNASALANPALHADIPVLNELFELAWGEAKPDYSSVLDRSSLWVTCFGADELVGFLNVAWDGGAHFFFLDTTVHPEWRRHGIATKMIHLAIERCRPRGAWIHVDASEELMKELYEPCGFRATAAGLIDLSPERASGSGQLTFK